MTQYAKLALAALTAVLVLAGSSVAVERVAPRLNVIEFYGGYAIPVGTYNNLAGIPFVDELGFPVNLGLDADDAWDPGFCLGVNYGQVNNQHLAVTLGFLYTRANIDDDLVFGIERPKVNVYDVSANVNWLFLDLRHNPWSPHFGVGFRAGLTEQSYRAFSNEYELTLDLGFNFGAEAKVWTDRHGAFMTLASINHWSFTASDERPRALEIGGGLKYYWR
ncbi:MAG: hypothetical protein KKA42_08675 [candidate division Zixibacteria bacterium]|nr:hypothetical protein [candidate division Zixibacteria bacterium]